MAVNLSPYGGVGAQFLDNSGNVLTGGKIFTYAGGTTTPQVTYTSSNGATPHPNPIILDAAGRVPGGEIWLTDGLVYKFILRDANDVLIATYDGLSGINSNFVAFTNQQEIQTATAGQTVFNLTTMSYQPGTNSLSVFVDGVNQYGPGAQYAYLETDSDTVTFLSGLHVGAEVKFTTSQLNTAASTNDAFQVSYVPPFTNSVATNVGVKLSETVSVKDFGAVGDGVADDTAAILLAMATGATVDFGGEQYTYKISDDLPVVSGGRYLSSGSTIYQSDVTKKIFTGTNVEDVVISGFTLLGASPNPLTTDGTNRAIEIYGPKKVRIENNIIKNWGSVGVFLSGSTVASAANGPEDCVVQNNIIDNTTNGIFFYVGGSGNLICNNIVTNSGRTGIFLDDVSLTSADTPSAVFTTVVSNNYIKNFGVFATGAGITSGQIKNCSIIGNIVQEGTGNGISLFAGGDSTQTPQACIGIIVDSNQIYDISGIGIVIAGVEKSTIQNNMIVKPQSGATGANSAFELQAITRNATTVGSTYNLITNNKIVADGGDVDYGIRLQASCDNNIVRSNDIEGATTVGVFDQGASNLVTLNKGFVTENKGTATILSGTTNITVTHGCNYTPSESEISVVLTSSLGAADFFLISNITSTTFRIGVNANPTVNVNFAWAVRRI